MLQSTFSLLRNVDFTFLEPLDQIVGREIDQFDGIGAIEYSVWHCLTHPDVSDLRYHVVEAVDVLDVDRGVDVNAVAHQLFDVEVTLGVAAALSIGVSEFVDQHNLWVSRNNGVDIHLGQRLPFIVNLTARNDFQPRQQRFGFFATVGLDDTNNNVVTVLFACLGLLKHLVGFAHAGRGAYEDSELADTAFLTPRSFKERLRRGSFRIASLIHHHRSDIHERAVGTFGTI
jgi:hypothetical protein